MTQADKTETGMVPSNGAGALQAREADELDAFGALTTDEMVLPVMRLVQGVSRAPIDSERAGEFYNTVTSEYRSELLVAILALTRSRSLFGESFDEPPLCASDNAVRPREVVEVDMGRGEVVTTGPTCATCAFAQWGTADNGKGRGQACRFTYNLLCMDLDDSQVYILRVGGVSLDGFRKYASAGRMKNQAAYALETRIASVEQEFNVGKAHVLTFTAGGPLPREIAEGMRQSAAAYQHVGLGVEGDFEPRETANPDDTHMSDCAIFDHKPCDCTPPDLSRPEEAMAATEAEPPTPAAVVAQAQTVADDIPFEAAEDFPPNPPMITEAQKNYLLGGGTVPREKALTRLWVEGRGGMKPIIAAIETLEPDIAAGVIYDPKAEVLKWRINILTEGQAAKMIDALKHELGIKTRKAKS